MSGPTISYGRRAITGDLIHIDNAIEDKPDYYLCPACGYFLQVRHGDVRIWYYAHKKDDGDAPSCPLRTQMDWESWCYNNIKKSLVQRYEENRKLFLILDINHYTNEVKLCGKLPTLSWDENYKHILTSISVTGINIANSIYPEDFHPSASEVLVELTPSNSKYSISVDTKYFAKSITGTWSTNGLNIGDVFIGSPIRAQRVEEDTKLRDGDIIFVIIRETEKITNKNIKVLKLGNYHLISFEVCKDNEELVNRYIGKINKSENAFEVNIILPADADPYGILPINGFPGSRALISITPPCNRNPLEMVSVPLDEKLDKEIISSTADRTSPHFEIIKFLPKGNKRLSIHSEEKHKYLNFHAINNKDIKNIFRTWHDDWQVGVRIFDGQKLLNFITPWEVTSDEYYKVLLTDIDSLNIEFVNPNGLKIDVIGYLSNSEKNEIYRIYDKLSVDLSSILNSWVYDGVRKINLIYGTLGSIKLELIVNELSDELLAEPLFSNYTISPLIQSDIEEITINENATVDFVNYASFTCIDDETITTNTMHDVSQSKKTQKSATTSQLSNNIEYCMRKLGIDINKSWDSKYLNKVMKCYNEEFGQLPKNGFKKQVKEVYLNIKNKNFTGIRVFNSESKPKRYTPSFTNLLPININAIGKKNVNIDFHFNNPDKLPISIEAYYSKPDRKETICAVDENEVAKLIASLVNKGSYRILVAYGNIGQIPILIDRGLDDIDLKQRVRELKIDITKKSNNTEVRKILGIGRKDTIPPGTHKKIRLAKDELKEEIKNWGNIN